MKQKLTIEELIEQLKECLSKIKLLCEIYDKGELSIAKEIAVKLRLLFHNTKNSKSLLRVLQLENNSFLSTALHFDSNEEIVFPSHHGLTEIKFSINDGNCDIKISPRFDANHGHFRYVNFRYWWEEEIIIYDGRNNSFLRKGIVLEVADTDGGAHIDESLKSDYYDITRKNSIGIKVNDDPINNPIFPSIRQIAYETILTFDRFDIYKIEERTNLIFNDHAVWQINTFAEFFSIFENNIKREESQNEKKSKDLQFEDLLAKDEKDFLLKTNLKPGDLFDLLRQHTLYKTIICSNFKEIFLISKFESGNYSVPLKWLIFRNEFEIFKKYWEGMNILQHQKDNNKLLIEIFCICLIYQGFKDIFLYSKSNDEFRYIIFGRHFWKIDKNSNATFEHSGLPKKIPEGYEVRNILKNYANYKSVYLNYMEFRIKVFPVFHDDMFTKTLNQ